jgi:hypothetical protein
MKTLPCYHDNMIMLSCYHDNIDLGKGNLSSAETVFVKFTNWKCILYYTYSTVLIQII